MSKPSSLILPNQDRRQFLKHSAVAVAAGASLTSMTHADDKVAASQPESLVKVLTNRSSPNSDPRSVTPGTTSIQNVGYCARVSPTTG